MAKNSTEEKNGSGTKSKRKSFFVLSLIGTVGVILVILFCIPVTVPGYMGYELFNVVSGSMEPELPVGSLVYVKSVEPTEITSGEIVAYQIGTMTITHRCVENLVDIREIVTKGDANAMEDPSPIPYGKIVGVVKFHLPFGGGFYDVFTSLNGKIYIIGLLAVFFILMVVGATGKDRDRN